MQQVMVSAYFKKWGLFQSKFNNKRAMEAIEKARAIQKYIIKHMARNSDEIYTPERKKIRKKFWVDYKISTLFL